LFNPGLSIGSPDDELNLNNDSLGFIMSPNNRALQRQAQENSIEEDLFELHQ